MNLKNIALILSRQLVNLLPRLHARRRGSLNLRIANTNLSFQSPTDFAFSLNARTGVLPIRLSELQTRTLIELEIESTTVHKLEDRLAQIIREYDVDGHSCAEAIARIGPQTFTKDHDWRTIVQQVMAWDGDRDAYMREALTCYLRYLSGRRTVVDSICSIRTREFGDSSAHGQSEFSPDKATVMLSPEQSAAMLAEASLRRLPQGEPVTLHLARGSAISLELARHRFSLIHNQDWSLVADNGKSYVLRDGLNSVGRGRNNDVSLDADFRNVSRTHLLAQPLGSDAIALTDVSSYGTYVQMTALAS